MNEAGSRCTDEELLEHALNNLPKEYENVVAKLEDRLGSVDNPLTIEGLRDELNLKYERMGFRGGKTGRNWNDDRDETALFAGGYKGKCNSCGEWGHKARDCKLKKKGGSGNNNKNEFRWKCYNCHEKGHKAKDCPKKKEIKDQANMANNDEDVISLS